MGWRIFKHTDADAPGITFSQRGSLAALLRACLIDGYGATTAVGGWSEPFAEVDNIAVFRADVGARQFYRIDDRNNDADVARMNAFETMLDIETGSGQWCVDRYFGKHFSDAYFGWVVIANEYSVHLLLPSRYGWIPHFFGEFESSWSNNPYRSCVIGHSISLSYLYSATYWDRSALIALASYTNSVGFTTTAPVDLHRYPDGSGLGLGCRTIAPSRYIGPESDSRYSLNTIDNPTCQQVFTPVLLGISPTTLASEEPLYRRNFVLGVLPLILCAQVVHFDVSVSEFMLYEYHDEQTDRVFLSAPISYSTDLNNRTFITYDITEVT